MTKQPSIADLKRRYAADPSSLTVGELQQLHTLQNIAQAQKQHQPTYIVHSRREVAEFFGRGVAAIDQWAKAGMPAEGRSAYDLSKIAKWRVGRMSDTNPADEAEKREKLALIKERRLTARQDRLAKGGKLLDAEEVHGRVMTMCTEVQSALLAIPMQVAPRLAGKGEAEIIQILDGDIRSALAAVADNWEQSHES